MSSSPGSSPAPTGNNNQAADSDSDDLSPVASPSPDLSEASDAEEEDDEIIRKKVAKRVEQSDVSDIESDGGDVKRRERAKSEVSLLDDDEDADLFGEGGDEEDAGGRGMEEEEEARYKSYVEVALARHPVPYSTDGKLHILRIPKHSLHLDATPFDPHTFTPPAQDASSAMPSPFTTCMNTLRVRPSPTNPKQLQSNARIVKWSDGSLTLQLSTTPIQYLLSANPLLPHPYDSGKDAHTFLTTPHESVSMLRTIAPLHTAYTSTSTGTVRAGLSTPSASFATPSPARATGTPKKGVDDDIALAILRKQMAEAARGKSRAGLITELIDPEKEKRKAEKLNKERNKQDRKQEAIRRRAEEGSLGISAGAASGSGGFFRRKPVAAVKRERGGGRGEEEDWDEEEKPSRAGRNEEYDRDDGFVAESDEEVEYEDDEDEGRGDEEEEEEEAEMTDDSEKEERRSSQKVKKRAAEKEEGGRKRRRVIDDDDEDEE